MSVFRNLLMQISGEEPTPYTELKFIQSDRWQYIDTLYMPTGSKFKIQIKFNHLSGSSWGPIIGSFSSKEYYKTPCSIYDGKYYVSSVDAVPSISYSYNTINEVEIETYSSQSKTGTYTIKNNGITIASGNNAGLYPYSDFGTGGNYDNEIYFHILLFSQISPTYGKHTNNSIAKLYYCKMWDDDVLVRDFIPVLDENNVACLYDKITKQYYYNSGSGSFTYETF